MVTLKSVSDRAIIVEFLEHVERQRHANVFFRRISLGVAISLLVLIVLKLYDVVSPLRISTVPVPLAGCILLLTSYVLWHFGRKRTLQDAARSIDTRADLHDEMKTALWFITNPRSSPWIEAQIARAARRTHSLDVQRFYPRSIPKTSYVAACLVVLFIGLNFLPFSSSRNWLITPRSGSSPNSILEEAERLLKKANALGNSVVAEQLSEMIQRIQQDNLGGAEAAALLKAFENELEKTAERMTRLDAQLKLEAEQSQKDVAAAVGQLANGSSRVLGDSDDEDAQDEVAEARKLKVKLEQERLEGVVDQDIKPEDLQPSRWTRSKLSYRNVRSEIKPVPQDFIEQDQVPREYRSVVKEYFEAISSAEKN